MPGSFYIRPFSSAQWQGLKTIRLEALLQNRGFFGSHYEREAAFTDEQWKVGTESTDVVFWGLYADELLIGMTGIKRSGAGAVLIASYIKPAYRNKGLSALLYEARIDWAKANGCKYIIVSHRTDNRASQAANQHFGFQCTHKENRLWPDGTEAEELFYRLDLPDQGAM